MSPEEEIIDKEATIKDQYDSLRILYKEIIQGYTYDFHSKFYIKHLTESESIDPVLAKEHFFRVAVSKGLIPEKEKEKLLMEAGDLTNEMNEEISFLEQFVQDNEKAIEKIVVASQAKAMRAIVEQKKGELLSLRFKKIEILGLTAESYSERHASNYLIYNSLFSDKELKNRPYTEEEFDNLDYQDIHYFVRTYNRIIDKYSERNLRKISAMPFFLNSIAAAIEQPMFFLNKPVTDFTIFQLNIFNRGKRNRFILSNAKGSPPDLLPSIKIQEVLDWYDSNYSIIISKFSEGGE